ncbi:MAG: PorV/PorQ family protein [candidate division KSB1 bacterium]|nr:PorV/PorQ family protein [candidate division KSB1 bacterium]
MGRLVRNAGPWVVLLLVASPGLAQKVSKVGTTAAPFLNIPVGARALGMGGAFVSVADDATALFWNPGGLARLPSNEAVFVHTNWIADIGFDFAGAVLNLGPVGVLGLQGTYLNAGEMERTTEIYPEGTGEKFKAGSYALGVTYARSLTDRFSIGGTVKYVREFILNSAAQGVAVDLGTHFVTQFHNVTLGAVISNFGTKMRMSGRDLLVQYDIDPTRYGNNERINANLETDAYDLPLMLRVGLSVDLLQRVEGQSLVVAVDAAHPSDNVEHVNVGGEYRFHDLFAVRGGYRSLFSRDSEQGFTVGAGLKYRVVGSLAVKIDYAYESFGRLNNVQKFSVAVCF